MAPRFKETRDFFGQRPDNCRGKIMYDKRGAITAQNYAMKHRHVKLRVYECHLGDHWHLTSRPPLSKNRINREY